MSGGGKKSAGAQPFARPFDGAISAYFEQRFPNELRAQVRGAARSEMLSDSYPYRKRMGGSAYSERFDALQIELQKLQQWIKRSGARALVLFEGRDAAGKGGSIHRVTENMNPRGARVVALPKPSDAEQGQWYFQRYAAHLPGAGELTLFDRSWYNRAGVETVMGFCSELEREQFFAQTPSFERMLVGDGVHLFKIWLAVGRAEQMRRFLQRESDPLKQWKLSPIDVASLERWDDYTAARDAMFARTHTPDAPWRVIRSDCKRRARLAVMQTLLSALPYAHRDDQAIGEIDAEIVVTPAEVAAAEA